MFQVSVKGVPTQWLCTLALTAEILMALSGGGGGVGGVK